MGLVSDRRHLEHARNIRNKHYVQVVSERDNTNSFCEVNIKNVNQMKKENDPTVKIRIRQRHIRGQRIRRELLALYCGACFMTQMSRGRN